MANILIAEDEKPLNNAYRIILEKEGHSVVSAFNGEEAVKKFKENNADILLLDILMPKMNGIEVLEKLQIKDNYPKTTVIILSNLDMDKEIQQAYKLGAYKYILKAITTPQQLAVLVNHLINKNLSNT